MLEKGIDQWQTLPEEQRRKMVDRFNQFFDLTSQEKQKVLGKLSDPERRQIDKTLRSFGALSPSQRAQCIQSFEKFAGLSLEERQQFLKKCGALEAHVSRRQASLAPTGQPNAFDAADPAQPPGAAPVKSVATNGS